MKYLIIIGIMLILLLVGCTQPIIDQNIPADNNSPSGGFTATCVDSTKHLVITDTNEGQVWECV